MYNYFLLGEWGSPAPQFSIAERKGKVLLVVGIMETADHFSPLINYEGVSRMLQRCILPYLDSSNIAKLALSHPPSKHDDVCL